MSVLTTAAVGVYWCTHTISCSAVLFLSMSGEHILKDNTTSADASSFCTVLSQQTMTRTVWKFGTKRTFKMFVNWLNKTQKQAWWTLDDQLRTAQSATIGQSTREQHYFSMFVCVVVQSGVGSLSYTHQKNRKCNLSVCEKPFVLLQAGYVFTTEEPWLLPLRKLNQNWACTCISTKSILPS